MRLIRNERGDTIVEVALALAILAMVLSASFSVAAKAYRTGQSAKERSAAVNLLQAQAEALRGYRDQSDVTWATFAGKIGSFGGSDFQMRQDPATKKWAAYSCGSGCTNGIYTVSIKASLVPPGFNMYQFDITSSWETQGGGTSKSTITTYLTNLSAINVCDIPGGC